MSTGFSSWLCLRGIQIASYPTEILMNEEMLIQDTYFFLKLKILESLCKKNPPQRLERILWFVWVNSVAIPTHKWQIMNMATTNTRLKLNNIYKYSYIEYQTYLRFWENEK